MLEEKLFFVDIINDISKTYGELLQDINRKRYIQKIVSSKSTYNIFVELITSLIFDLPITVIDDLSENEIHNLEITAKEIKSKHEIIHIKEITLSLVTSTDDKPNWEIIMFTSGTTGLPKKVAHSFKGITKFIKIDKEKSNDIYGFSYNPTHVAGLQVFFQALLNVNTIINLTGCSRSQVYGLIEKYNITNISATPTFYRLLLPFDKEYPSVKKLTSGGEKSDEKLFQNLSKIFPNAEALNVYGSTEAAGPILASKGDLFEIKPKYINLVKIDKGELLVHRDLLGKSDSIVVDNNWFRTGDLVEIVENTPLKFRFLSRKNEMINIGGHKVNPNEVEQIINLHPSVMLSNVYGKKNSVLGNILIADIKKSGELEEKELRRFLQDKLQPFKIPRMINFVDKIELTRTGKLKRI